MDINKLLEYCIANDISIDLSSGDGIVNMSSSKPIKLPNGIEVLSFKCKLNITNVKLEDSTEPDFDVEPSGFSK